MFAGFSLALFGVILNVFFLNYIPAGLSVWDFLHFSSSRSETILMLIGVILFLSALITPSFSKKNEHVQEHNKYEG
ncbi:hypothetical protein CGZ90_04020 [Fictibacillus aquaticus]|uniref:Uncharacterized protein n=1 Tax=Fictibacillus aquaticus TaxID=2021314 RepID=A0A235FDT2_9BACL|nr:hypothetical protein CGZ90_04020 [Fictibacillus aquaticus]